MEVCIRENYLDKVSLTKKRIVIDEKGEKHEELKYSREELVKPPFFYQIVEVDDKYEDCAYSDFDYVDDKFVFNPNKYNARKYKQQESDYEMLIVAKIRERYNVNQELAILRQRDTKPQEFDLYNDYVEDCKKQVKEKMESYL